MTEIEPIIENVREGDIVTIESGTPGELGYSAFTVRVTGEAEPVAYTRSLDWLRGRAMCEGWKIARIARPPLPIPTEPGERFWARWRSESPGEYIVTYGNQIVDLSNGEPWKRGMFERHHTVVPAPGPETVPVPVEIIQKAEEWSHDLSDAAGRPSWFILRDIVHAVREREEEL